MKKKFAGLVGAVVMAAALTAAADEARKPAAQGKAAKAEETKKVTGQHRGYTNDKLFFRADDGTKMTFLVDIPGDKERKWHDEFKTLARITVTYHPRGEGELPVATAIESAKEEPPKE